jgi:Ca2+-binding RTX toxin-like protein
VINSVPAGTFAAGYAGSFAGLGAVTYAGIEKFDITSGTGNDSITTGDGNDIINNGTGSDTVNTGAGIDYIYGNAGDMIDGGIGVDTLNLGLELTSLNHTIDYDLDNSQNGTVTFLDADEVLTFMNIENVVYESPLSPTVTILVPSAEMCMIPELSHGAPVEKPDPTVVMQNLSLNFVSVADISYDDTIQNGDGAD